MQCDALHTLISFIHGQDWLFVFVSCTVQLLHTLISFIYWQGWPELRIWCRCGVFGEETLALYDFMLQTNIPTTFPIGCMLLSKILMEIRKRLKKMGGEKTSHYKKGLLLLRRLIQMATICGVCSALTTTSLFPPPCYYTWTNHCVLCVLCCVHVCVLLCACACVFVCIYVWWRVLWLQV